MAAFDKTGSGIPMMDEAGILYTAVFEGNHTIAYHPEILESDPESRRKADDIVIRET